ncbi:MAG: PQQ-binding-like beta-propeller repeat protein [Acidimicrobiales bacterium]
MRPQTGTRWRVLPLVAAAVLLAACSASAAAPARLATHGGHTPASATGPNDWTSFGNGPQHGFVAPTTITAANVATLHEAWYFHTGDAVTATPTVVHGVVYFGSWDTKFYAVDLATGTLKWSYQLDHQPAVTPYPGEHPRNSASDGGLVTSSAWYEPADASHPDLVIFGGGYTLYALDADDGSLFWKHVYDGLPSEPPSPTTDPTRIFSSPIVVDGNVYVGVDTDGQAHEKGYIAAANLLTGAPTWIHQTDVNAAGKVLYDGCGGVWSSGTYLPVLDDVVFTVADCNNGNSESATAERVLPLDARTGALRWSSNVVGTDPGCECDEVGTTAGLGADGAPDFLGAFGKGGTYTSLDPTTGAVRWSTRAVFGGAAGGFIGSPAYTGSVIYGATGIGDTSGGGVCQPGAPGDAAVENPSFFAIDAATGAVLWHADDAQSFGSTTYAGDSRSRAWPSILRPRCATPPPDRSWPRSHSQTTAGVGSPSRGTRW